MQNAIGVGLSVSGFRSTFAPSYELVAKMLMLGSQQASLHCSRLTASLQAKNGTDNMQYETKVLTTKYQKPDAYGALSMPVYLTAAFEFPNAKAMNDAFCGRSMDPSYARIANPTTTYLEERVRQITGATSVTALNTGMAAIAYALTAVSGAGLNIVASKHLFGNSVSLIRDTLGSFGVEPRFADFTKPEEVEALIDDKTAALFFEIITNPQLFVADIRRLSEIAHKKGVPLIADTTIVPFPAFNAGNLGVDIEVVSSTKYISGGGTGLGGLPPAPPKSKLNVCPLKLKFPPANGFPPYAPPAPLPTPACPN